MGVATLLLITGVIAWDVATSSDPIRTAVKDTWVALGTAGAAVAAETIASAAITAGLVAVGVADTVAAGLAFVGGIAASVVLVLVVAPVLGGLFELTVNSLSLRIPEELMTSKITVIQVPLSSSLLEELTTPLF